MNLPLLPILKFSAVTACLKPDQTECKIREGIEVIVFVKIFQKTTFVDQMPTDVS
jgi:hypothetical protein